MKDADRGSVATVCSCAAPLTFGSLFAGVGGLDLGFERAGLVCKWQVEIDPFARMVLEKHWPGVPKHDDVRTFTDIEHVDVIAGGFPCQDVSNAGHRAGINGERSGLFFELMRIVRDVGPRYVLLENVSALLVRGMDRVLSELASLGYDAEWDCIPAAAVGAPHIRDRLFLLAYANGVGHIKQEPAVASTHNEKRNTAAFEPRGRSKPNQAFTSGQVLSNTNSRRFQERTQCDREAEAGIDPQQWDDSLRCGPRGWWEAEPSVGRVVNGIPSRVDRLRGLGNAVVPQVAEWIGRQLVAAAS